MKRMKRKFSRGMRFAVLFSLILTSTALILSACEESTKSSQKTTKSTYKRGSQKLMGQVRTGKTGIEVTLKYKNPNIQTNNFLIRKIGGNQNIRVLSLTSKRRGKYIDLVTEPMSSGFNYNIGVISYDEREEKTKTNFYELQLSDKLLNSFYSDKKLGCIIEHGKTTMRLFAPRASKVILSLFNKPYSGKPGKKKYKNEKQYIMKKNNDGTWEYTLRGEKWGELYGYRVFGPKGSTEEFHPEYIIADPYSKAVATLEIAPQSQLSVIVNPDKYKWRSKKKYMHYKMRNLIIYESHVRDLTMMSPNIKQKGTYEGLVEQGKGKIGGINHIKDLGVNAIELMPTQEFNEIEAPYREKSRKFVYNTWNTYGRNHWGYMTSSFFAPEAFYLRGKIRENSWVGASGKQVFAFKHMVDQFHRNNIAVLMDVVYNHVSQYDRNALKYIDKKYYFYLTSGGAYESKSGCGNDFNTQRRMSHRLIVDSVAYWTKEYRVDGFRFDLATMIDRSVLKDALKKAKAINPYANLIAEPWAMSTFTDNPSYDPSGFDAIGMGAWNDKTRNLIKGADNASWGSRSGLAMGNASVWELRKAVKGYPKIFKKNVGHNINYIESHDNSTFSDMLRFADKSLPSKKFEIMPKDYIKYMTLDKLQMKQNKIAALVLLTLQGSVMINEGQDFARSKVVFPPKGHSVFPPNSANWVKVGRRWYDIGKHKVSEIPTDMTKQRKWLRKNAKKWSSKTQPYLLDHDSYEKDNKTNWLNWKLKKANKGLFEYYKGLIRIRRRNKAFTTMNISKIKFINAMTLSDKPKKVRKNALGWIYDKSGSDDSKTWIVLVNADRNKTVRFTLPAGTWKVAVDAKSSIRPSIKKESGTVKIPSMTGMVLYQ